MSLLAKLKQAALAVDPQFQVNSNEVSGVVSALAHYEQYGEEFLKAAESGVEEVTKLLQPPVEDQPTEEKAPEPAPAAEPPAAGAPPAEPVTGADPSDDDLRAVIADLQAQLDSRAATSQQTQVVHEPGVEPEPQPPAAT